MDMNDFLPSNGRREAWVTLTTNDDYAMGCMVLAESLRRVGTQRTIHCLVAAGVSEISRNLLASVFDTVTEVEIIRAHKRATSPTPHTNNPEIVDEDVSLTKINVWKLIQYKKCVFLDADTIVVRNSDELFENEELSAVGDRSGAEWFSSDLFVLQPSLTTFWSLYYFLRSHTHFHGGIQELLNTFFKDWKKYQQDWHKRLSCVYNMVPAAQFYTFRAAWKKFQNDIKIVHFMGRNNKPWKELDNSDCPYRQLWKTIFESKFKTRLEKQGQHGESVVHFNSIVLEYDLSSSSEALDFPSDESPQQQTADVFNRLYAFVITPDGKRKQIANPVSNLQNSIDINETGAQMVQKHNTQNEKKEKGKMKKVCKAKLVPLADEPEVPSVVRYGLISMTKKFDSQIEDLLHQTVSVPSKYIPGSTEHGNGLRSALPRRYGRRHCAVSGGEELKEDSGSKVLPHLIETPTYTTSVSPSPQ